MVTLLSLFLNLLHTIEKQRLKHCSRMSKFNHGFERKFTFKCAEAAHAEFIDDIVGRGDGNTFFWKMLIKIHIIFLLRRVIFLCNNYNAIPYFCQLNCFECIIRKNEANSKRNCAYRMLFVLIQVLFWRAAIVFL